MLPYDKFRKLVKAAGKTPSTDIRTAAEATLTANAALVSTRQNQRTLQKFLGHDAGTSLKHYHLADSKLISDQLRSLAAARAKSPRKMQGRSRPPRRRGNPRSEGLELQDLYHKTERALVLKPVFYTIYKAPGEGKQEKARQHFEFKDRKNP